MRSLRVLSAGVVLAAVSGLSAQGAGSLRFSGSAAVGASVDVLVGGGPPAGSVLVVLSPSVGSASFGTFATDCFALSPAGLLLVDVPLSAQGSARLRLPIPSAPSLAGVYLAGLGLGVVPGAPRTNCASFMVVPAAVGPELLETFDDRAAAQPALAAADWAGTVRGVLRPGRVGGSGRLGRFDPAVGDLQPDGAFEFRTDDQVFPAAGTLSGGDERVTDGVFEFLDFVVPAGVTVRFTGARPAQLLVAGEARIEGVVEVSAPPLEVADGTAGLEAGQAGGAGGAGAGAGGAGGDLPSLAAGAVDGRPGEDLQAAVGAWAGVVAGSGGRGSPAHPAGADPLAVRYGFFGFYSNQIAGGAGGGGHVAAGAPGQVVVERPPAGGAGPSGPGGLPLGLPGTPTTSRADLLIGGAGGGGGGTHAYDSVWPGVAWTRGSGGGGGGALLLAVGGDLTIGIHGALRADGGAAAARDHDDGAFLAPGGGGSGGTILLQVGGALRHDGEVSARGGAGGRTEDLRVTRGATVVGGDGAAGRIRIEGAAVTGAGGFDPAPENGNLDDRDLWTTAASAWLALPVGADPAELAYELHAVQDAVAVLWSDVAGVGIGPARRGAAPFVVSTRFAELDARGRPIAGSEGPWTEGAAAPVPGANAVQFMVQFDRGFAGAAADLRIEAFRLSF